MSRFAFEIPGEIEAGDFLDWRRRNEMFQGELYADALACSRRVEPVTTEYERAVVRAFTTPGDTFACSNCGRFAFAVPTLCHWCR
jgi:hypothetical protein